MTRELVLVGGGHAHVQVLRRLAMASLPGVHTTLVVDRPVAVYSGMVPGFVAGHYGVDDLAIDLRPLARRAGVAMVVGAATRVLPGERRIELPGRPPIAYDAASFDVGSQVAGLDVPGAREFAFATRPIGRFVSAIGALAERMRGAQAFRAVVVGAGAAGVELALALRARLAREGVADVGVALVDAASRLLPGFSDAVAERAAQALQRREVTLVLGAAVARVEPGTLVLAHGGKLDFDALVWAAGAASVELFRASDLPTDEGGFVRVQRTLQVEGHDELFAAGDCARFEPPLAKAGVYAVRQGPVLDANLRAFLAGGRLRRYRPQREFLVLLNLGDGSALGAKWGRALEGPRIFALKDWIDRGFMRRFQVLDARARPTRAFPPMQPDREMRCGGCAAKLGERTLQRALARVGVRHDPAVVLGLATPDDAAAVTTASGDLVVASVDGFRAFTDDPWLVGRVAAVNATSDLFAKGATPRFAMAFVTIPDDESARAEERLFQVLAGARAAFDADGVTLVGGHTTAGGELTVGFAVWGSAASPDALLRQDGLAPGDLLILTKPLGTGVLFAADVQGRARGQWIEAAITSMCRSNAAAARVAREVGARAATDVSGFGLVGHLAAMLRASQAFAHLALDALPLLPGTTTCLALGLRSTAHPENAKARGVLRVDPAAASRPEFDVLFDPQTSGGLLFGVVPARAEEALERLREAGDRAACIGAVEERAQQPALLEITLAP